MKHRMNILRNRFQDMSGSWSRERRAEAGEAPLTGLYRRYRFQGLGVLVLAIVIALMFPREKTFQFSDLKEGRVYIGPEIIATSTFPVNKSPEEYAQDVEKAKRSVAPVFRREETVASSNLQELQAFLDRLGQILREDIDAARRTASLFSDNGVVVTNEDLKAILESGETERARTASSQRLQNFRVLAAAVLSTVRELYTAGVLEVEKSQLTPGLEKLSIRSGGREELEEASYCYSLREAQNYILEKLRTQSELSEPRVKVAYQIATRYLHPNLLFEQEETQTRRDEAVALVPLAKDQVLAGERIIDGHQRITKEHIDKLNSYAMARAEQQKEASIFYRLMLGLGKLATTLLILSLFLGLVYHARRQLLDTPRYLLIIGLVALLTVVLTYIVNELNQSPYLIPVATGAMIITIFFDSFVGLFYVLSISLLLGTMRGNEYGITFISLFVSSAAILSVSRVRTRNWLIRSIAVIVLVFIAAISVLDLLNYVSLKEMMRHWGLGVINGFLSPIFAYALIIIFENIFDMTTDMTLLELSDLNHPLLRQLAMQAPGTYHHSIVVGNLAEAATEAVGGNSLLARVGAYYHDIGKMEKPEYFVENQMRGRNPQEKLTPTMSSLILLNHVRRGSEMARQYGLPKAVEAFIFEHHGTSLMNYFYQKAVEQSEGEPVSQTAFRYPGPRPQGLETAIVMLADAVEAATRSLRDPSPNRIKTVVEQIIDERFKSGELDNSPLTLQNLSRISEAFQKIIYGTLHRRIEYPVKAENPTANPA